MNVEILIPFIISLFKFFSLCHFLAFSKYKFLFNLFLFSSSNDEDNVDNESTGSDDDDVSSCSRSASQDSLMKFLEHHKKRTSRKELAGDIWITMMLQNYFVK
jgi:hypothetical protein